MPTKLDLEAQKMHWRSRLLDFGEDVLLEKRRKLRKTQLEISKNIGLNQSQISRLERGLTRPLDIPTIEAVCSAYKLSLKEKQEYFKLSLGIEL